MSHRTQQIVQDKLADRASNQATTKIQFNSSDAELSEKEIEDMKLFISSKFDFESGDHLQSFGNLGRSRFGSN